MWHLNQFFLNIYVFRVSLFDSYNYQLSLLQSYKWSKIANRQLYRSSKVSWLLWFSTIIRLSLLPINVIQQLELPN